MLEAEGHTDLPILHPSSLKQAIKLSIKVPSLYPEERSILISEDKGC